MNNNRHVTERIIAVLNLPVVPSIITFILVVIFLAITMLVGRTTHRAIIQKEKLTVLSNLGIIRSNIEGALNSRLLLGQGLVSYISVKPDITAKEFEEYSKRLVAADPMIRNITILKETTIKYAYPLESNKLAIGVDLSKIPAQKDSVMNVLKTGITEVIVNVNLIQGGIGTINRIPIYSGTGTNRKYWGQASIVLMQDILFKETGLFNGSYGLKLSLYRVTNDGEPHDYMFGSSDILKYDPVVLDVKFPNGLWRLSGIPENGWGYSDHTSVKYIAGGSAFSIITGMLIFLIMKLGRIVQKLESILPICSGCKKIRDDKGYWDSVDSFLSEHSKIRFSHSLCPDCAEKLYTEESWYRRKKE